MVRSYQGLLIIFVLLNSPLLGANIQVCPRCEVKKIAEAIRLSPPKGTIEILEGTYFESNLKIEKPLTIKGVGSVTIDAQNSDDILTIHSNDTTIEGLTFKNSGFSYVHDLAAIKIAEAQNCTIQNNTFENNYYSIHVAKSSDCRITNNKMVNSHSENSKSGDGIHVWYGQGIILTNNEIIGYRDGIYLEFTKNSRIENNTSTRNLRYGLHFMFSDGNSYIKNEFSQNSAGVAVMYSKNILMEDNRFEHSLGSAAYGLLLKDISASTIINNKINDNTVGIYMEGCTRSVMTQNYFKKNGWALRILANSESNQIKQNTFDQNTFDVSTNSSGSYNDFDKNRWSSYVGADLNADGFGDLPYRPVKVSAILMERYPISLLMIKSLFFYLIDQAEDAFPVITPEKLLDPNPSLGGSL